MKNSHHNMTDQKHARRAARKLDEQSSHADKVRPACRAATPDVDTNYALLGIFPTVIAGLIFQYARPWTLKEKVVEIFDGKMTVLFARPTRAMQVLLEKPIASMPDMIIHVEAGPHETSGLAHVATIDEFLGILNARGCAHRKWLDAYVVAIIKCKINAEVPD